MAIKQKSLLVVRLLLVLTCLYIFFVSIGLMEIAFQGFGEGFAEALLTTTSNPFVALFVGLIATSIVQSSSTTTSVVVGLVSSGALTVTNAVPIIMGANIGTTITNTLVALGSVTRREEFRRSFSGAIIHDLFNLLCVFVFFPLEMMFGLLEKMASFLANAFVNAGGIKFASPLKYIMDPATGFIQETLSKFIVVEGKAIYIVMVILSFLLLFSALYFIVKLMKSLIMNTAEAVLDSVLGTKSIYGILIGIVITVLVQSSSITTSLLVPLMAAGVISLELAFPITIGANIGTTTTAILASFATGNPAAITIAFVHFLFNFFGTILIYPVKFIRRIPIALARGLGELVYKKRRYAFIYVAVSFFIVPSLLIFLYNLLF